MQFQSTSYPQKLKYFFHNGNISPEIALWLYKKDVSVRPDYLVVGRNGWVFLGDRFQSVVTKSTGGYAVHEPAVFERWSSQLKQRQDWLERNGIKSIFVIAPNKHSIYPEKSPPWLAFGLSNVTRKLVDRGVDKGVYLVDPTEAILSEKKNMGWLYNRSDTHWTFPGAFVSYGEVMLQLKDFYPDLKSLTGDDVFFTQKLIRDEGITKFLGFPKSQRGIADRVYEYRFSTTIEKYCVSTINEYFIWESACEANEPLSATGDRSRAVQIDNAYALNELSVLIVEDSFGAAPAEYYNRTFTKVWHAHSSFIFTGDRLKAFVKKYKPDLVIYRIVERNLLHPISYEFDGLSELKRSDLE